MSTFPKTPARARFTAMAVAVWLWASASAHAVEGVLIQVDTAGRPTVTAVDAARLTLPDDSRGLIVWADGARERWQWVQGAWRFPRNAPPLRDDVVYGGRTRGAGGDGGGPSAGLLTTQIEQLNGAPLTRGGAVLTPGDGGRLLDGRVTFRLKADKDGKAPAVVFVVSRDKAEVVRVPFAAGQTRVRWSEIPDLPKDLAAGLSPGTYTLRKEGDPFRAEFTVEDPKRRAEALRHSRELARLLESPAEALAVQVAVDELLAATDADGKPRPYLADALDRLESVPEDALTPYLKRMREAVEARLQDPAQVAVVKAPAAESTGVKVIDQARDLIAAGKWAKALNVLDAVHGDDAPAGRRTAALAGLYRGVILAESGQANEEQASAAFQQAVKDLEGGDAADLYRAHNDFANFLMERSQDRLYDHAFQMAAGVKRPLLGALTNWMAARAQYEAALESAAKLGPDQARAVRLNLARLYALLGDALRTLADPGDAAQRFPEGEKAAAGLARQFAEQAAFADGDKGGDPLLRAAGEELLAHLAFRDGAVPECLDHAHKAEQAYRQAGSLVGTESVERLLGLIQRRTADAAKEPAAAAKARDEALRHFLIAHQLAETLREQLPADRAGLSRAGFFARRAYVNEQIVDLLIGAGKDAEALRYAELAKARALQDLLAAGRGNASQGGEGEPAEAEEGGAETATLLSHWPKDVAALEYFLGGERGWVFVIDATGPVKAYELKESDGRPISTRDLISRVEKFLKGIGHQASRMTASLNNGRGYDHSWQDDLEHYYKVLIPSEAAASLRRAKTVVIVPHHILHYFPFAALVTERDGAERGPYEMVKPKFLIDEPFDLCYAPSLAAWDLLRQNPVKIDRASALGIVAVPGAPELPGVADDLKNLKAAFPGKIGAILEGDAATKAAARDLFRQPGLLLISSHGQNLPERPLESFLMLYPGKDDDGRLTAGEIYGGEVNADLVVMSACYSGLADQSPLPGDDLFGLQRAFLQAGARAVISGQWDIYDGTSPDLTKGLLEGVAGGKSPPAALAASQRAFLARLRASKEVEPFLHPYFWAVYTAAGDDRAGGK